MVLTSVTTPLEVPSGSVTTFRPRQTVPYGIPWSNVSRWEPSFTEAAAEWQVDVRLLAAMAILESDANQYHTLAATGTRDQVLRGGDHHDPHPSIGIMQIKPFFHQATLPDADVFTPQGNIRLGARLMRDFIHSTGSWQQAIAQHYHPGVSPHGVTPQDYIDTIESLMAEMRRATLCLPVAAPAFDGTDKVVNGITFHADRRTVTSKVPGLRCRQFANLDACETRTPLEVGETIEVLYWLEGEAFNGENRWWVTGDGSRVWSGGTVEKPAALPDGHLGGRHLFNAMRAANMVITQAPFQHPTHSICDCYDFGIPIGTPIPALAAGRVIFARPVDDQYRPHKVTIRTDQLGDHVYAHLVQIHVAEGDTVEAGTIIGLSGTENGPHLHLQLDRGFSQLGLNLTQILEREGFDLDAF